MQPTLAAALPFTVLPARLGCGRTRLVMIVVGAERVKTEPGHENRH
jgi:hypothetical protein